MLGNEMEAIRDLYTDFGYMYSDKVGDDPLIAGIAKAFVPDQFPRASSLRNVSIPIKHYFENTVQPELQKGIQAGNEKTFANF